MARLDLTEPYAVRFAREAILDSFRSHGEECVLLHTYHIDEDENTQPRCPECFDAVYEQGDKFDCPTCLGTTFQGGIKAAYRAWGLFTDASDAETVGRRGVWHPVARSLQTEHEPDLWQRDYVVRVARWDAGYRVAEVEGVYALKQVSNETLRTGGRHGQTRFDAVGQRADLTRIAETMPVYRYVQPGAAFDRADGRSR